MERRACNYCVDEKTSALTQLTLISMLHSRYHKNTLWQMDHSRNRYVFMAFTRNVSRKFESTFCVVFNVHNTEISLYDS